MGRIDLTEKEVMSSCKNRLTYWENCKVVIHFDRINSGKVQISGRWIQLAKIGSPDLVAYINYNNTCYIYFIECKRTSGGITSDAQLEFAIKFRGLLNVIYEVVTNPKQIDITIEKLTSYTANELKKITMD